MNNEDMSDMIQKLTTMLNHSNNEADNKQNHTQDDVSSASNTLNEDTLRNLFNNLNLNNQSTNEAYNNNNNDDETNPFNFDINTILKMKNMMDKINSNKNDPRSNLLMSLKPYLNDNRKEKLDQYIQFLNISKVLDAFHSEGGVNSK